MSMNYHIESYRVRSTGRFVAEVIDTETGRCLHATGPQADDAQAQDLAEQWANQHRMPEER